MFLSHVTKIDNNFLLFVLTLEKVRWKREIYDKIDKLDTYSNLIGYFERIQSEIEQLCSKWKINMEM